MVVAQPLQMASGTVGANQPQPWLGFNHTDAGAATLPGRGDGFQPHFDSVDEAAGRYLVFLWYLNDVHDAGQTSFPLLDLHIAPRAGRLLVFPPYWMFAHEGRATPTQDKYILSTYLRFPSRSRDPGIA